jgi:hypothetical protein
VIVRDHGFVKVRDVSSAVLTALSGTGPVSGPVKACGRDTSTPVLASTGSTTEATLKHDVVDTLGALLRKEGFTNISTLRTSHDVSLSAVRGDARLVTHISYRESVPSPARPYDGVPGPSEITVRPRAGASGHRFAPWPLD